MSALPGIGTAAAGASARSFALESLALFDAMSVKPGHARSLLIDSTIRLLAGAGVWSKLDILYLLAAHDAQAGRLNWKAPASFAASVVDSPVFTADRGYNGNAAGYLDTGFNPTAHGTASQNNAHIGIWPVENTQINAADAGNANLRLSSRTAADALQSFVNASTVDSVGSVTDSRGHIVGTRSASGSYSVYKNGSSLVSHTRTSTAPSNATLHICARNGFAGNNNRQIAAMHCGPALSGGEIGNLHAILGAYLTAVGAV